MMAKTRSAVEAAAQMKPALVLLMSIMSSSCFLILVVSSSVLFGVSDGASVPITSTSSESSFPSPSTPIKINPSTSKIKDNGGTDDTEILESLASSRILMDHTSSSSDSTTSRKFISKDVQQDGNNNMMSSENRIEKAEEITPVSSSSSVTTGSTTLPTKVSSFSDLLPPSSSSIDSSSSLYAKRMMSSSSPLHVARCRATCIEKFHPHKGSTSATTSKTTSSVSFAIQDENEETSTSIDEMHLLPILRLKRRKRSASLRFSNFKDSLNGLGVKKNSKAWTSASWSCLKNSLECLSCWNNCETLENQDTSASQPLQDVASRDGNTAHESTKMLNEEAVGKIGVDDSKQHSSLLPCSSNKLCMSGCQVACSFYQNLYSSSAKTGENNEHAASFTTTDPVVAMKHESRVKIAPGKITWPALDKDVASITTALSPVVYVVIQEYPDRKWRQIAQTTETEIVIPTELTSSMSSKLRSIRVLVVGKTGLLSVYNPVKDLPTKLGHQETRSSRRSDNANDKSNNFTGKVNRTSPTKDSNDVSLKTDDSTSTATTAEQQFESMESVAHEMGTVRSGLDSTPISILDISANDHSVYANTPVTSSNTPTPLASSVLPDVPTPVNSDSPDSDKVTEEKPFELRVVSLIHQKSLVIAELRWDEIGGNPSQDYLITWELTGGGLKGHLVTDSTSVTLSLWPDTTYQIQVEKFQQNLDSDGEQPAATATSSNTTVTSSMKSLPLTVDTSEASFPLEQPSALLSSRDMDDEDTEDDYEDEDVSLGEGKVSASAALGMGVSRMEGKTPNALLHNPASHKSITGGFLNMTLLIGIAISALLFVLVILTVAAFTWTRMRAVSDSPHAHHHHRHHHNRAPSPSSLEYCSSSPMITPVKNSRNSGDGGGGCCYDCDGDIGDDSYRGCYSESSLQTSEPQPLLYNNQEDYSWDECHHHHNHRQQNRMVSSSPFYSVGLHSTTSTTSRNHLCRDYYCCDNRTKEDANSILQCSFETSPQGSESSGVAVISGYSNDLTMPLVTAGNPSSSSHLNFYRGGTNIAYSLFGDSTSLTVSKQGEGQRGYH